MVKKEEVKKSGDGVKEVNSQEVKGDNKKAGEKYKLSLESMLKAGVHFGHKKSRWNPKMKQYIFGTRNNVHVIDLEKTLIMFQKALDEVESIIEKNGIILIVGTKKQAKELVGVVASKINMPYVNERWVGGTFTNFNILKKRIKYFVEQSELLEKGKLSKLTKLERNKLGKKLSKIKGKMGGLVEMKRLPDAVFVLDVNKDRLAVDEARNAGVKVIGLVDTNSNPDSVDFPIPANDDALSSLKYLLGVFLKKVLEKRENMNTGVNS